MAFALTACTRDGEGAIFLMRGEKPQSMRFTLSGDGMQAMGIAPARLTIVEAREERDILRATLDAARCPGVGTVLLDMPGRFAAYDLTASRRLLLAAERSGTRVILLRGSAEPRSSAAWTRWSIESASSVPWMADAPGWPAIMVELLRSRGGGAGGKWRLEWLEDQGVFGHAAHGSPLPGLVVPLAALRTGGADHGAGARAA
jgi:protein ImuA